MCSGSRLQRGGRRGEDSAVQTSARLRAAAAAADGPRRAAGWGPHRGHHRRSEVNSLERICCEASFSYLLAVYPFFLILVSESYFEGTLFVNTVRQDFSNQRLRAVMPLIT